MTLSDELHKLAELRERGQLTDQEFARAKARLLDQAAGSTAPFGSLNAFRRSRSDRQIAGVCGGLARATGLESWAWRLIFVGLFLCGGLGLLLYLLLAIFVPSE
jgi:phage shock protein C